MLVKCPVCQTEYELDSPGKYKCGCGAKFFVLADWGVSLSDPGTAAGNSRTNVADPDRTMTPQTRHAPSNFTDPSFDPERTVPNIRIRHERGDLQPGDVILGRYELLEKLGSGAMGVVFKCKDRISGVEYALKMVPPELVRDAEAMEDVRENFKLVHGLKHQNIASMDFLDRDEYGSYFLIMEYVQGESLTQWIKKKWRSGRPESAEIVHIVKQIAAALDYAHSQQILHRDIKPANVMVDEKGNVKVLDFGLASKVRSTMTALSVTTSNTSGTPHYLSPEQFKGKYPGPASDQYALGVLTYQMFAGHLPFEADDFNVLSRAVLQEEPDPIGGIPPTIEPIILKALYKNPKERFENCVAFAEALSTGIRETKFSPDTPLEISSFRKAAGRGDAFAQCHLGNCYYYGKGAEQDYTEAVTWYRKAAEQGYAEAQYKLGDCYSNGQGVKKDINVSVKWYRKAAEQGNVEAQWRLGYCYLCASGFEQDYGQAVKWLRMAAEKGNGIAHFGLGQCYENGLGVEKDINEANNWYRKAVGLLLKSAAQDDAEDQQLWLGECYHYGLGVEQDFAEAVKWYRKAADLGNAIAQWRLGNCYSDGLGITKNDADAVKWYRKAAEQENTEAQWCLGNCYSDGQGVTPNDTEAVKWYRKAAEQGHGKAQFCLAACYENGLGVEKNIVGRRFLK